MPAPLKAPGLVISTVTGYFHSINLPQPSQCCCQQATRNHRSSLIHTHPNKRTSSQSIFQHKVSGPMSTSARAAASFPSIPARHRYILPLRWVRPRYWNRQTMKGVNRPLPVLRCSHMMILGRTLWPKRVSRLQRRRGVLSAAMRWRCSVD